MAVATLAAGVFLYLDFPSWKLRARFKPHSQPVSHMQILKGNVLISSGWDGAIKTWDLEGIHLKSEFQGSSNEVMLFKADPNTDTVCISYTQAGFGPELRTLSTGERLLTASAYGDVSNGCEVDGGLFTIAHADALARLAKPGIEEMVLPGQEVPMSTNRKAVNKHGTWIAAGNDEGAVQVWDGSTGESLRLLEGLEGPVQVVKWSSTGHILLAGAIESIIVWNTETWKPVPYALISGRVVRSLDLCEGREWVAVGGSDGYIQILDLKRHVTLNTIPAPASIDGVQFSSDGSLLLCYGMPGKVILVDTLSDAVRFEFPIHSGYVTKAVWSQDERLVCIGTSQGEVDVWERNRPVQWWGVACLPSCWVVIGLSAWWFARGYVAIRKRSLPS